MAGEKALTLEEISKLHPNEIGDEEGNTIAAAARAEVDEEKGGKKKEEKKEEEEHKEGDEETAEEKAARETKKAEEKATKEKEEKEAKDAEDARILVAEEKDLKDEEKARKATLIKEKEEKEKALEEEADKVFAERKKLPLDRAKEERGHIKAIIKKYEKPEDLADAFLNIQRAFTKSQDEVKNLREAAPIKAIEQMSDAEIIQKYIEVGKIKVNGKALSKEEAIAAFRKAKPAQTEESGDDAVLAMMSDSIRQHLMVTSRESIANMKVTAKDKREEILTTLSEGDKKYSDEIREVLNSMSDQAVLHESFSPEDIILWAKGKKVDDLEHNHAAELKKSYDEGYKKGKEEAKILGVKSGDVNGQGKPPAKKTAATLSEAQKKEALDMFDVPGMTDEEKYAAYLEVEEKKKKEK